MCFLCNLGLLSQDSSIRRETCHVPNTATLHHGSSIRSYRCPNRANGVDVFEGCPIRYNRATFDFSYSVIAYEYSYIGLFLRLELLH